MPPWIRPPSSPLHRHVHRAVEGLAVEAVGIDIMEEIGGRDRRVAAVERDDDPAEAGIDRDRDQVFLGGRRLRRRLRAVWAKAGSGGEERASGKEFGGSWASRIAKARMNRATQAFPPRAKPL